MQIIFKIYYCTLLRKFLFPRSKHCWIEIFTKVNYCLLFQKPNLYSLQPINRALSTIRASQLQGERGMDQKGCFNVFFTVYTNLEVF